MLSLLGATLTLPGIAGLVLTIGMAVDSNVLIYERIREERRAGTLPVSAIDIGFRAPLATIIDSNLTTLIAAGVLFDLGSGPVRGFAVTLAIGIFTTVFTAFTLTRLIIALVAAIDAEARRHCRTDSSAFVPDDTDMPLHVHGRRYRASRCPAALSVVDAAVLARWSMNLRHRLHAAAQ